MSTLGAVAQIFMPSPARAEESAARAEPVVESGKEDCSVPEFTTAYDGISLSEWRGLCYSPRAREIWNPLEPFFAQFGYVLWKLESYTKDSLRLPNVYPPQDIPRSYDGQYMLPDAKLRPITSMMLQSALNCYAYTQDGRYVVIRLIKKGDQGEAELEVLRHVASGRASLDPRNHALPMLREIHLNDMVFGVFPLMSAAIARNLRCGGELVESFLQVAEGVAYLHENLVAHLDLDYGNILVNYAGYQPLIGDDGFDWANQAFHDAFPARFFFIDFELSVCYAKDSTPEDRRIRGFPVARITPDIKLHQMGRPLAPEMTLNKPYDPFAAEIYQFGAMLHVHRTLGEAVPAFAELLLAMTQTDPASRPSAVSVLATMQSIKRSLDDVISSVVFEEWPPLLLPGQHIECIPSAEMDESGSIKPQHSDSSWVA